ncbi:MAG: hypothetical protein GXO69_05735 [Acidobacteria bacterium]|nr:hypothetical protein [Acidobacteriota bacterium]
MNTGKLFPDGKELNLKGMDSVHRKVMYYNIVFPGMGFVYAGDFFRSLIFGGGAVGFLFLGTALVWHSVRSGGIHFGNLLSVLLFPLICFVLVLVFHVFSILKSGSAVISTCSARRAVWFTVASIFLVFLEIAAVLAAVWQAVPWQ